jgi:hypothetical protein
LPLRAARPSPTAAKHIPEQVAEHIAEHIGDILDVHVGIIMNAGASQPIMPELVITFAFFGIAEDFIRLGAFLKLGLGVLVARFLSGWYFNASRRYVRLMSSAEAFFSTPSTS